MGELKDQVQGGLDRSRRGSTEHAASATSNAPVPTKTKTKTKKTNKKAKQDSGNGNAAVDGSSGSGSSSVYARVGAYTPLHYAAGECDIEVLQSMMDDEEERVDVNMQDQCGCPPLHWAASVGRIDNVQLLLEFGADDTITNYMGLTALGWARARNKSRIEDQLEQMAEKSSGQFMDRDNGACADKINVKTLLETVHFLKQR